MNRFLVALVIVFASVPALDSQKLSFGEQVCFPRKHFNGGQTLLTEGFVTKLETALYQVGPDFLASIQLDPDVTAKFEKASVSGDIAQIHLGLEKIPSTLLPEVEISTKLEFEKTDEANRTTTIARMRTADTTIEFEVKNDSCAGVWIKPYKNKQVRFSVVFKPKA